ncbi:hypothetical protein CTI14_64955, partial [Methylobacterium radiotolerans]
GILPDAQARKVMQLCWSLPDLKDAGDVARAASRGPNLRAEARGIVSRPVPFPVRRPGILPDAQARKVMQLCWSLPDLKDAGDVARAAS